MSRLHFRALSMVKGLITIELCCVHNKYILFPDDVTMCSAIFSHGYGRYIPGAQIIHHAKELDPDLFDLAKIVDEFISQWDIVPKSESMSN